VSAASKPGGDVQLMIESPPDGATVGDEVVVQGWCLSARGAASELRVRADGRDWMARTGVLRPDVAASHPAVVRSALSGFEASVRLGPGVHELELHGRFGDGDWQVLGQRRVVVGSPLRASLDTPSPLSCPQGAVRFSGWCVHAARRIADLRIRVGAAGATCQYGLERPDVAAAIQAPGAERSGFEANIELAPGRWPITLVAVLDDGSEAALDWPQSLQVLAPPLAQRLRASAGFWLGLVRHGVPMARAWIRDNRRLPRPRELPTLVRFAIERQRQRRDAPVRAPAGFTPPEALEAYASWQAFNTFNAAARADLERRLAAAADLPLLSVVMPVYDAPLDLLDAAVASVRNQVYPHWELCIADDASTDARVPERLRELAAADARIRVHFRDCNGNISLATNTAAETARGEFIVLLDQDDLLTADALGEIALAAAADPAADVIYSDDDKIDLDGRRFAPQFKPDWSPELLLGYMYFSHVFAVRRALYQQVGGMRAGFEGSQDYDFALRATEKARAIVHVPQVLYHWRALPGSTASSGGEKPASFEAGRRAVADALARRGIAGEVQQPDWARKARVGIFGIEFPDDGPKVSILIPTRNGLPILRRCIESLARTTYRNYEVVVIDNDSDDAATLAYLHSLPHRVERIANPHGRFNFAWINNRGAERVDGELLLFLNNDTEVVAPRGLSQMVGWSRCDGVGAVGARLLFPDRRIQHAGIVHGYYRGLAGPAFKLAPEWDNGYLSYARVTRDYSAVTAACLLTPRQLFLESGGFDAERFEVAYNDVDYCYRLAARGLRSVYCADAELLHHEGHSRGFLDRPEEVAAFRRRYAGMRDPYYSPHLSLEHERFAIQPRRHRPGAARPVRALMCAFNLNWEGAPYSQLELTLGLKRAGCIDPVVYAPSDGPLREAYEQAGIEVRVFAHPLAGVFTEAAYDRALDAFGEFIASVGAELVYGNTLQTFYAIDAAQRRGLPTLWNPRESEPWQSYFNFLPAPLAARALRCFEYPYRVIFVAEATRAVWAPLDSRGNFTVIHNGLDAARIRSAGERWPRTQVRRELGIADDDVAVLLPGTVCERKGQQELIHALAQLPAASAARLRCFIVGDRPGAYSVELRRLAAALPPHLRERVSIIGETHEIARYYRAADVFVCTSRVESFPRVVLEAMAFGLPVVSTRVFGIAEQVGENVNALLYEPGDAARLAAHLQRMIDDDALRAKLAANSPHVLATLNSFEEMVDAYATSFREAALTRPPAVAGAQP
jgi:glycosyltransferase involved in cell wall biosynthesis